MSKSKRRDFLRNSALAGLLAPVAAYWPDVPEARAQDNRTNLCLIWVPLGKVRANPFLNPGDTPSFAHGFEPYNEFSDRCIAFREYATQPYISANYRGLHAGHAAPGTCMFTGRVPRTSGNEPIGAVAPSVDQMIAWDYVQRGVARDPLRKSLHTRLHSTGGWTWEPFVPTPADYNYGRVYEGRTLPGVNPHLQPQAAFDQMFGDLGTEIAGSPMEVLWARRESLLDRPVAELRAIRTQLPSEGVHVLDEHLQSLRELEASFADAPDIPSSMPTPTRPEMMDVGPGNFDNAFSAHASVIDLAFRFDRTRVATFQFGQPGARFPVESLGLRDISALNPSAGGTLTGNDHHSYTHWRGEDVPLFLDWYSQRVTELLRLLQGGGDREDMLSKSAVMVGTEFGENHNAIDVPITMFGECQGYFDTGKVVTYGNTLDNYWQHLGTLLALTRAMGCDDIPFVGPDESMHHRGVPEQLRR